MVQLVRDPAGLRAAIAAWRADGHSVGLFPTMGGIHDGHRALTTLAADRADRVCATIFVNPRQFGPNEDLARYPRDEAGDATALADAGADLIYAPAVDAVYPDGFATEVRAGPLGDCLEGAHRPGFFTGVATVVTKLLLQALPDIAVFGEKDFQQLQVIRALVRDLDIPVDVVAGPTVREADGLAWSSRNRYLSDAERAAAPALYRALCQAAAALAGGADPDAVAAKGSTALTDAGFEAVDYFAVCEASALAPLPADWRARGFTPRLLAAARLGGTRLIDNVGLEAAG